MANKRLISSDIFTDEFYISLDMLGRNLWIGLIVTADDQGRMQDNAALIRSAVFPADDIQIKAIAKIVDDFVSRGKLHRYEKGGKKLLQITNWWKHQNPQWPNPSSYPSPDGWLDRVKFKGRGGKVDLLNWDEEGGFIEHTNTDSNALTNTSDNVDTYEHTFEHTYNDSNTDSSEHTNTDSNALTKADEYVYVNENVYVNVNENELSKSIAVSGKNPKPHPPPETKSKPVKHRYGEHKNVLLTEDELKKYQDKYPDDWQRRIDRFSEAMAIKNYSYKSHYLALLKWDRNGWGWDNGKPPEQERETKTWNFV